VTPYRTSDASRRRPEPEPGADDDPVILWLALVVSLLGLVPRLLVRGSWGAEATLALLVAGVSSTLLVRHAWRSRREGRR
jgi:hypothetical protein